MTISALHPRHPTTVLLLLLTVTNFAPSAASASSYQLPGIPAGTYTSAGNKGQFSTVVPSHDLVIVRTVVNPQGKRWQQPEFVAEVIATLEE